MGTPALSSIMRQKPSARSYCGAFPGHVLPPQAQAAEGGGWCFLIRATRTQFGWENASYRLCSTVPEAKHITPGSKQ